MFDCPSCGARLIYDPAHMGLVCGSCGYTKKLPRPEDEQTIDEIDFGSAVRDTSASWGTETRTVTCSSCGAITFNPPDQMAGLCPFCGSAKVLSSDEMDRGIAPTAVVPFTITKEEIRDRFYKWNKFALWSPEDFRKGKVLGNLTGVYIPFWSFDTDTVTTYSGKFGVTLNHDDGTGIKWTRGRGVVRVKVDDYPVPASRRFISDRRMEHIDTFNINDMIPYTPEALTGFIAEKYTVGLDDAWKNAKGSLRKRFENAALKQEHADNVSDLKMSTEFSNITFRYVLFPIWISSCNYKGKIYRVVANGRDGRGFCDRPVSPAKIVLLLLITFLFFTMPIWISFIVTLVYALL